MSKHTPGPWHLDTEDEKEIVLGDSSFIATTHDSSAYSSYTSVTEDQVKANARLIAAAPELLEALKACLAELLVLHTDRPGTEECIQQAYAAIAKAEGEINE